MCTFDEYLNYWINMQRPIQTTKHNMSGLSELQNFSSDFIPIYITTYGKDENKHPVLYLDIEKWKSQYSMKDEDYYLSVCMMDKHFFRESVTKNINFYYFNNMIDFDMNEYSISDQINRTAEVLWYNCKDHVTYNLLWIYFISKQIYDNYTLTNLVSADSLSFIVQNVEYFMECSLKQLQKQNIKLPSYTKLTKNILPKSLLFQKEFFIGHKILKRYDVLDLLFNEFLYIKANNQMCVIYDDIKRKKDEETAKYFSDSNFSIMDCINNSKSTSEEK